MRALVIVDIHKSKHASSTTMKYIKKYNPELLLIAGDITTFGPMSFATDFFSELPDIKILALPGNCDPREILEIIDNSRAENLHGKKVTIDGVTIVGLGGSNSTPFNTPFELTEDEIFSALDSLMEPGVVLLLHFPAYGHLDEVPRGEHTGSRSALKIVEKYQPALVISGHIHETRGTKVDENGIHYLNPGPMREGYAAIVDIDSVKEDKKKDKANYKCTYKLLP
jgi:Icc-related predicted phosphoesterase